MLSSGTLILELVGSNFFIEVLCEEFHLILRIGKESLSFLKGINSKMPSSNFIVGVFSMEMKENELHKRTDL